MKIKNIKKRIFLSLILLLPLIFIIPSIIRDKQLDTTNYVKYKSDYKNHVFVNLTLSESLNTYGFVEKQMNDYLLTTEFAILFKRIFNNKLNPSDYFIMFSQIHGQIGSAFIEMASNEVLRPQEVEELFKIIINKFNEFNSEKTKIVTTDFSVVIEHPKYVFPLHALTQKFLIPIILYLLLIFILIINKKKINKNSFKKIIILILSELILILFVICFIHESNIIKPSFYTHTLANRYFRVEQKIDFSEKEEFSTNTLPYSWWGYPETIKFQEILKTPSSVKKEMIIWWKNPSCSYNYNTRTFYLLFDKDRLELPGTFDEIPSRNYENIYSIYQKVNLRNYYKYINEEYKLWAKEYFEIARDEFIDYAQKTGIEFSIESEPQFINSYPYKPAVDVYILIVTSSIIVLNILGLLVVRKKKEKNV